MDTRAQGQEAICQQHTPDKVTKAIKGQMKIQTFYSRALTAVIPQKNQSDSKSDPPS